jgi:dCMP deaminase
MNWDEMFIEMAMLVAKKSKDPSTKVGCVIVGDDNAVLSTGFNGFPRGVREELNFEERFPLADPMFAKCFPKLDPERWDRPQKYSWIEHAERNAIFNAARHGIMLAGARAYLNWEPHPCADCSRALIQSGIVEIIGPDIPFGGAGNGTHYDTSLADEMCGEAGVKIRTIPWKLEDTDTTS